jgi:hypothetical protein
MVFVRSAWAWRRRRLFSAAELLPAVPSAGGAHLKPLGKSAQNARNWFATVEIERISCDPVWLDKAIRIVEKQVQEQNQKQRGKEPEGSLVA